MFLSDAPVHPSHPAHPARMLETRCKVPWIPTATGRRVDLLDPKPEQISIEDIAFHLAGLNRFTGATRFSVAQHSVYVSRLCKLNPLAGLLHDAHEAYLCDLSRPLKDALDQLGCGDALRMLARRFDLAIAVKFGIAAASFESEEVKHADGVILATEKRDLLIEPACRWDRESRGVLPPPLDMVIRPECNWVFARNQFLARFRELVN